MRKFGIFLGNTRCANWQDFDRFEERECCGGRKVFVAFNVCSEKGVVESERECTGICLLKVEKGADKARIQGVVSALNEPGVAEVAEAEEPDSEPVEEDEPVDEPEEDKDVLV